MTLTMPGPNPDDEFDGISDVKLRQRMNELMRRLCPSCDLGLRESCTCADDVAQAMRIEDELARRADAKEDG